MARHLWLNVARIRDEERKVKEEKLNEQNHWN